MGRHRAQATRTLRLDIGRLAAACVPVAVLVASSAAVAADSRLGDTARGDVAQVLDVPDAPVTEPGSVTVPERPWRRSPVGQPEHEAPPVYPASAEAATTAPGVPARALQAYQHAARLLAAADPACRLDWQLLAAIGMVESHHGTYGGNRLDADGVARPGIYGIPLDGRAGTARILDSDGGALDRDTRYDRAVGPMQFIPGTWRLVGSDAEPDGRKDPQDIDDAAAAAGVYLCSGPGDLSDPGDRYAAVFRYNHSDAYVRRVLAIADVYSRGQGQPPSSVLAAGYPDGAWARGGAVTTEDAGRSTPGATVMTPAPPPGEARDGEPSSRGGPSPSRSDPAPTPAVTSSSAAPLEDVMGVVGDAVGGVVGALPVPAPTGTTAPAPAPTGEDPEPGDPDCLSLLGIPVVCPIGSAAGR